MEGATYAWTDTPRGAICEIVGNSNVFNTFVRWPSSPPGKCDCTWLPTGSAAPDWRLESSNPTQGTTRVLVAGLTTDQCRAVCLPDKGAALALARSFVAPRKNQIGDVVALTELAPGTLAVALDSHIDCVTWPNGDQATLEPGDYYSDSNGLKPVAAHPGPYKIIATGLDALRCSAIAGMLSPSDRRAIASGDYEPVWNLPRGSAWTNVYGWGVRFSDGRVATRAGDSWSSPSPQDFVRDPCEAFGRAELANLSDFDLQDVLGTHDPDSKVIALARTKLDSDTLCSWIAVHVADRATRYLTSQREVVHESVANAVRECRLTWLRNFGLYIHPLRSGRYVGRWRYGSPEIYASLQDLFLDYIESPPDEFDMLYAMFDGESPSSVRVGAKLIEKSHNARSCEIMVDQLVTALHSDDKLDEVYAAAAVTYADTSIRLVCERGVHRDGPWPVSLDDNNADCVIIWNFGDRPESQLRAAALDLARAARARRTAPHLEIVYLTATVHRATV